MGARRGAVGPCWRSPLPCCRQTLSSPPCTSSRALRDKRGRATAGRAKRHQESLHSTRLGSQRIPLGLGDSGEPHGCGWRGAAGLNLRPVADILFRFRARDPAGLGSPTAARPCLYHGGRRRPCKYNAAAVLPRESLLPTTNLVLCASSRAVPPP